MAEREYVVSSVGGTRARVGRWLGRGRRSQWRRRSDPEAGRDVALAEEADYWRDWLATKGGRWPAEYDFRFSPTSAIADPVLRDVVAGVPRDVVSILDVGAGPASMVGSTYPGKTIELVAVDPLAETYNRLLEEFGVTPPVCVQEVEGERLHAKFGMDRFDVAYSRNALDHAVDPACIINNMVDITRPGGRVVLRHVRNEGEHQDYVELHQWNFDVRNDRLMLWRPGTTFDVQELLLGKAHVRCWLEPSDDPYWAVAVLTKSERDSARSTS